MGNKLKAKSKFSTFIFSIIVTFIVLFIVLVIVSSILRIFIYPDKYIDIISKNEEITGIDPYLVLAIVKTESGFNELAVSSKDAKGLMQIKDSTASETISKQGKTYDNLDLFDPSTNIEIGMSYFSYLIDRYNGNYYLAVCAYNAGLGNVDNWIEQGIIDKNLSEYRNVALPFDETKKYLQRVISNYMMYKLLYKY